MGKKYYEYNLYDDDEMIKNTVLYKSKMIHLPLFLILLLQDISNNEDYEFYQSIFEINNIFHLKKWKNIL